MDKLELGDSPVAKALACALAHSVRFTSDVGVHLLLS
jgi:hypothetical protein